MQPVAIDDKARHLIETLSALGDGWHTRSEIAAKLGKRKLNPAEVILLDMLANEGKLERQSQLSQRNLYQWEYRIKQG